jgi:ATP-dependent RNA helicase DDX6/DHH1
VTSDLLGRGIDIKTVNVVVNFDFPHNTETYLHRIQFSEHIGHLGLAISLITNANKHSMFQIEQELKCEISPLPYKVDKALYT